MLDRIAMRLSPNIYVDLKPIDASACVCAYKMLSAGLNKTWMRTDARYVRALGRKWLYAIPCAIA